MPLLLLQLPLLLLMLLIILLIRLVMLPVLLILRLLILLLMLCSTPDAPILASQDYYIDRRLVGNVLQVHNPVSRRGASAVEGS